MYVIGSIVLIIIAALVFIYWGSGQEGWQSWPMGRLPNERRAYYGPGAWWPTKNLPEYDAIGATQNWPQAYYANLSYPAGQEIPYDVLQTGPNLTPGSALDMSEITEREDSMARPWDRIATRVVPGSSCAGQKIKGPSKLALLDARRDAFLSSTEQTDIPMIDGYVDKSDMPVMYHYFRGSGATCLSK